MIVSLSWDEGRGDEWVLEALGDFAICHATFFPSIESCNKYHQRLRIYKNYEVGNHGMFIRRMHNLTPEEIKNDLSQAQKILECEIQKPVRGFAYPLGTVSDGITEVVQGMGFQYGRMTGSYDSQAEKKDWKSKFKIRTACRLISPELWNLFTLWSSNLGFFIAHGHAKDMTKDKLKEILKRMIDEGAEFVTVETMCQHLFPKPFV